MDPDRGAPGAPPGRGSTFRLGFGQRWALALLTAGGLTVAIEAPAIAAEPFFVGVNTAVVLSLVGLGHYLAAQHGERVTGACFVVAGAGWVVLSLDVHHRWGSLPSWLFGSAIVYTAIGCGILHYGRARLDRGGTLVDGGLRGRRPPGPPHRSCWCPGRSGSGFSPDAFWPSLWPDRTATTVLVVAACLAWLVVGGLFARVALRQLRSAPPAQRRILRPLTLAGAGWARRGSRGHRRVATLAPGLVSLHGNSNIVGLLSVSVTAALAAAINRSRVLAATFVDTLPSERTPESLTAYVRGALSDPTAELLFVVPGRDILIDGVRPAAGSCPTRPARTGSRSGSPAPAASRSRS